MHITCSTEINARVDTSNHGLSPHFESSGALAGGLTSIKTALVKCLLIANWAEHTEIFRCHHRWQ